MGSLGGRHGIWQARQTFAQLIHDQNRSRQCDLVAGSSFNRIAAMSVMSGSAA
jgi:hypothetical protein